jgi:GTP-binding protein
MFIDKARIQVQAGVGGRGCVSFRREKFVPRGGPDGGDGGKGGDIYLLATREKNTLLDFRYKHHFKSDRGRHGEGAKRTGRSGEDLTVLVPVGTVVSDSETGEVIADLDHEGAQILIARGGRGGKGNSNFATATVQAPDYAQEGTPGEQRTLELELKLIADVGLLGFPNAGKSTLLSAISAAKPKIASYPFTTLQPVLGTVAYGYNSTIVVADIPGIIEGASQGHGLGLQFLRHIERTRLLLHLVDVSTEAQDSPVVRYGAIQKELSQYGKGLSEKPQIVVATKIDIANPEYLSELQQFVQQRQLPFVAISAETKDGIQELLNIMQHHLQRTSNQTINR